MYVSAPPDKGSIGLDRVEFAKLVIHILRHVGDRLGRDLFSTAALDMMLDLYVRDEHRPISLTNLSGAAAVPERTALFTINKLVSRGLLVRYPDPKDGRRVNVDLSAGGLRLLEECIDELMIMITEQ